MKGKVEKYLEKLRSEGESIHFSLIDPEKLPHDLEKVAKQLYNSGTSAFLVGGTLGVTHEIFQYVLDVLGDFDIPKIIFPSNTNLVDSKADAILFMSLLNSDDLYFVVGAQVYSSLMVKKLGLEALPTAYLIIGNGGTASHIGKARPIPFDNYVLASAYASAAELLGMRYIYLEAGSGSPETVRPEMIKSIKSVVPNAYLIVGGGIRSEDKAISVTEAGADIIVTGNLIEENIDKAVSIIERIRKVKKRV
ncbi:geranylgeranylglyceryl/heptaprenylglyceryl phosphate synthase [Sulfolobales archaeon HS-7]|nr:geranylgeranylglyceryl/heptaprenylglyceryl phosphate synthase [Sulfolobales archaeon HS-7]